MRAKIEKLIVVGQDTIIFPFRHKLHHHSANAIFIDKHHHHHHPSCNPLFHDKVCADIIVLPGGIHAVRISWHVAQMREVEWTVMEHDC